MKECVYSPPQGRILMSVMRGSVQAYENWPFVLSSCSSYVGGKCVVIQAVHKLLRRILYSSYAEGIVPSVVALFLARRVCNVALSIRLVIEFVRLHEKIVRLSSVLGLLRIMKPSYVILFLGRVSLFQVGVPCKTSGPFVELSLQEFLKPLF